ncbi:MAG: hypothetical protein Q9211_001615 [Gyalolechia sp. 1 TL-2023]
MASQKPSLHLLRQKGGLKTPRANLSFQTKERGEWERLSMPGSLQGDFNISHLVINHTIQFQQKAARDPAADPAVCSLVLEPRDYRSPEVTRTENGSWVVRITCQNVLVCTFRAVSGDPTADYTKAMALPLATEASKFTAIQLTFGEGDVHMNMAHPPKHQWQRMFTGLLTGKVTLSADNDEGIYIDQIMKASFGESQEQQGQLKTEEGCRITTRRNKGGNGQALIVQVWPRKQLKNMDMLSGAQKFAQRYTITGSQIFAEAELRAHPNHDRGAGEKISWQLSVYSGLEGLEAPLIGTLSNTFTGPADIDRFANRKEDDVKLIPVFNDVAEERARASLSDLAKEYDRLSAEATGFLTRSKARSLLPVRQLFLQNSQFSDTAENILDADIRVLDTALASLNDRQREAVIRALKHKISIVWGPAATGKSEVLTQAIYQLHLQDKAERTHVCAVTNVAVDQLADRTYELFKQQYGLGKAPRMLRIYSNGQTQAQYARGDRATLSKPTNIEQIRYDKAAADPRKWQGFLTGANLLRQHGIISDEAQYTMYQKEQAVLTQDIVDKAAIIFSTCAGSRGAALFRQLNDEDVEAWPATSCIIDEVGCANPAQVLLPIMSFRKTLKRLILAGDHKQLPPFVLSDDGKRLFPKSWLKQIVDSKKWPVTQLNKQYRMHRSLYGPVRRVIYAGMVDSHRETDPPSHYLQQLLNDMPLTFNVGSQQYALTTYLNFVDVAHGVSHTVPAGSSYNIEEVEAISAYVVKLLSSGRKAEDIVVMTGYLDQLGKLKEAARKDGWLHVRRILTVDTSQGDQYRIVIISLVKTNGGPGFLGELERANVACSRAMEAMYFFGSWKFWDNLPIPQTGRLYMHRLLRDMRNHAGNGAIKVNEAWRPEFVVSGRSISVTQSFATILRCFTKTFHFLPYWRDPKVDNYRGELVEAPATIEYNAYRTAKAELEEDDQDVDRLFLAGSENVEEERVRSLEKSRPLVKREWLRLAVSTQEPSFWEGFENAAREQQR